MKTYYWTRDRDVNAGGGIVIANDRGDQLPGFFMSLYSARIWARKHGVRLLKGGTWGPINKGRLKLYNIERIKCFSCDASVKKENVFLAHTNDGQNVMVGKICANKIQLSREAGFQPPKGGPKLWRGWLT